MFSKLNYTYLDMKQDGFAFPIAKMKIKYIKPAELGDILIVKSEILSIEPALDIKYTIFNKKTQDKIFEAKTMQIAIDINTRKSVYTAPNKLIEALKG